jgi:flagellar motor switch protein FliM
MTKERLSDVIERLRPGSPPETIAPGVKIYDFKRPDKFSKDQIRTVAIMHETFARQTTTTLSSNLRCLAHVHVASVDQLTYEEFIRAIPNPCTVAIINMEPLKGAAVIQMDPAVTFAIIDRLFGGQGEEVKFTRELTDIEASVIEGSVVRLLGSLHDAWATVLDLRPRLTKLETNPQFAQIVPPREMIVLVTLEVRIGDTQGMMNIVLPYLTIEPIVPKLSAQYFFSSLRKKDGPYVAQTSFMLDIPAEVYWDGIRLSLHDIGGLKKGSLVKIPGYPHGRAFLRMGGRTLFGLKARRTGRRSPVTYAVVNGISKESIPFLEPMEKKGKPSDAESIEPRMRQALGELGSTISESLTGIKSSISALRQRQDELADQLAFGAQGQETAELKPEGAHAGPFDVARRADSAHLLNFIQQEHPQTIALILSYLEPQKASAILGGLAQELQPEVARRIACMGRTSPDVLREVDRVLEKKLSLLSSEDYTPAGGVRGLVEILNMTDRSTERLVVEALEKSHAELAEEIKQNMFVFEDIVLLDRKDMEKLVKKADTDVLLRAMKGADTKLAASIWGCMPHAEAERFQGRMKELGPVRLGEVERAQQRVVALIREMEEAGEIFVTRMDEKTQIVE